MYIERIDKYIIFIREKGRSEGKGIIFGKKLETSIKSELFSFASTVQEKERTTAAKAMKARNLLVCMA